jgi:glutathione S-transferase
VRCTKKVIAEPQMVDLMDANARAAYKQTFPIGKVPMLMPASDHMIPESTIIIEYLEGEFSLGTRLIEDGLAGQLRSTRAAPEQSSNDH